MRSLALVALLATPAAPPGADRFDVEASVTTAAGKTVATMKFTAVDGRESNSRLRSGKLSFALKVAVRRADGECQFVAFSLEQSEKADTGHVLKGKVSGTGKTCRGEWTPLGGGFDGNTIAFRVAPKS